MLGTARPESWALSSDSFCSSPCLLVRRRSKGSTDQVNRRDYYALDVWSQDHRVSVRIVPPEPHCSCHQQSKVDDSALASLHSRDRYIRGGVSAFGGNSHRTSVARADQHNNTLSVVQRRDTVVVWGAVAVQRLRYWHKRKNEGDGAEHVAGNRRGATALVRERFDGV